MILRLPSRRRRLDQQFERALPLSSVGSPQARARQAQVPADVRAQFDQHLSVRIEQHRAWWRRIPIAVLWDVDDLLDLLGGILDMVRDL